MNILDRFLRYVSIDTQSDENSSTFPSTQKQFHLLELLKSELLEMGLTDVTLDEKGYLMAGIPANTAWQVPVIGFIAHVDTSPDMPGNDIKPVITPDYQGQDLIMNKDKNLVLSPKDFPELLQYLGKTLVSTDGTTLLGADDKAGVAAIMSMLEFYMANPDVPHGAIRVCFTPDEEIGKGVDHFDVARFGADFAYTIDGGAIGELEYENFNAAHAKVSVQGRNIHPGYAKGKMINALLLAMEFNAILPVNERPEFTSGYEGFYHLIKMEGSVEAASFQYIIRDHDKTLFEKKKEYFSQVAHFMNARYGEGTFSLELRDQYFNMKEKVEPVMHVVETARRAMEGCGIEPLVVPIRGGTDGARLSYMGLPCPNLFAGGHNFHGKHEFVPVESMEKAVEVILKIIELYAKGENPA